MLCEYGCGQEAIFTLKNKKQCCGLSANKCPTKRKAASVSLKKAIQEGKIQKAEWLPDAWAHSLKKRRDIAHNKPFAQRSKAIKISQILIEQNNKCLHCKIEQCWNNQFLVFQLDHIDGNRGNDNRDNLRLLCPNCHSQTETFGGKKNRKEVKISEFEFLKAIKETKSLRQALNKLNLPLQQKFFDEAKKIKEKFFS